MSIKALPYDEMSIKTPPYDAGSDRTAHSADTRQTARPLLPGASSLHPYFFAGCEPPHFLVEVITGYEYYLALPRSAHNLL